MKSERGITLTSLVIYIIIFFIILSIMAFISNNFYSNIAEIKDSPIYMVEFNKFSMFFVTDVKQNSKITSIAETTLEFGDGTTYRYENNTIYRNDDEIAKYVKSCSFTQLENTVDAFTKTIINVNMVLGNKKEEITRNIDFVLRYW